MSPTWDGIKILLTKTNIVVDNNQIMQLIDISGYMYFFRGLGNIIGPFIVGSLFDLTSSYTYGCYMCAGCLFTGSILNEMAHLFWNRSRRGPN